MRGLARTARVITSAALIMIFVFGAFVLNPTPEVKMFGLGLAFAVLVDATIVRMMLVPSIMEILGDANWWFPKWLNFLPRLDIEGGADERLRRTGSTARPVGAELRRCYRRAATTGRHQATVSPRAR